MLATNHQTFARRKIKSLTIRLLSKLKRKGKLDKKSKKVKMGQLVMRSRVGQKLFDYADLMPFHETEVKLEPWSGVPYDEDDYLQYDDEKNFINASYIKTLYGEENEEFGPPFGLMIATRGPTDHSIEQFWKMVIQQNIRRVVSLCQREKDTYYECANYYPQHLNGTIEIKDE